MNDASSEARNATDAASSSGSAKRPTGTCTSRRCARSPEEEYALSGGLHRDPQAEGYDAMEEEVFGRPEPKA
jgi:hypothetical protein